MNWDVESRRDRFEDEIFPLLEGAGLPREELQLAWDFRTASRQSTLGKMEWIRDDALERMGDSGPSYTLDPLDPEETCDDGRDIGRTITGVMSVPLYTELDEPGTMITRGDDGEPYYNGETEVEFMLRIPCSLIEDPEPAPIVQYGHGLLGGHEEMTTGYLGELANENKWVLLGVSWTGMKEEDVGWITVMIVADVSDFGIVPERSMQGLVEAMGAMRMAMGDLSRDAAVTFDGTSVIDPERRWYYGNSQGAIMGGALLAMSPDIHRGVLGVGGAPYQLLLPRSQDFSPFFLIFKEKFLDHREIMLLVGGLIQQLWDPTESAGWLRDLGGDAAVPKEVLMQVAIGDAQVTTLGAHVMARALGASTVAPQTREIWGVEEREPPFMGPALVEWEYTDVPEEPEGAIPPDADLDPHECPRREDEAKSQLVHFLTTGEVDQYCDGPCVSEAATCR
jgi:hypothetical protein